MIGIEIDPNGPWHHDEESNVTYLVAGVRDPGFPDAGVELDTMVATYTGQGDKGNENDWAIVQFAVVRAILDVSESANEPFWLIHLELLDGDPASLA